MLWYKAVYAPPHAHTYYWVISCETVVVVVILFNDIYI